jgi:rubrerythrin
MNQEEYKKIISFAIDQEIAAYNYYHAVSEKTADKNLKYIFSDLAEDEKKHRVLLEGFLKKAPDTLHFSESKDYKVTDTLSRPQLTLDLKPIDGIIIAIKAELEAMQMYTQLANASTDAGQKSIFLELAMMERGHKSRLEDIYTNMAFPEVW